MIRTCLQNSIGRVTGTVYINHYVDNSFFSVTRLCFPYYFFFRKKLARRLLFDKSANDEHERSILTKLKQQCGGQFTSKMEGMVSYPDQLCCI